MHIRNFYLYLALPMVSGKIYAYKIWPMHLDTLLGDSSRNGDWNITQMFHYTNEWSIQCICFKIHWILKQMHCSNQLLQKQHMPLHILTYVPHICITTPVSPIPKCQIVSLYCQPLLRYRPLNYLRQVNSMTPNVQAQYEVKCKAPYVSDTIVLNFQISLRATVWPSGLHMG